MVFLERENCLSDMIKCIHMIFDEQTANKESMMIAVKMVRI
jgi:hypothetical protein